MKKEKKHTVRVVVISVILLALVLGVLHKYNIVRIGTQAPAPIHDAYSCPGH